MRTETSTFLCFLDFLLPFSWQGFKKMNSKNSHLFFTFNCHQRQQIMQSMHLFAFCPHRNLCNCAKFHIYAQDPGLTRWQLIQSNTCQTCKTCAFVQLCSHCQNCLGIHCNTSWSSVLKYNESKKYCAGVPLHPSLNVQRCCVFYVLYFHLQLHSGVCPSSGWARWACQMSF